VIIPVHDSETGQAPQLEVARAIDVAIAEGAEPSTSPAASTRIRGRPTRGSPRPWPCTPVPLPLLDPNPPKLRDHQGVDVRDASEIFEAAQAVDNLVKSGQVPLAHCRAAADRNGTVVARARGLCIVICTEGSRA
jgi:hypothetical protein